MNMTVDEYLRSERQWPRVHRITYARAQRIQAVRDKKQDLIRFWTTIINRLKD